jgi:hypothetical protein
MLEPLQCRTACLRNIGIRISGIRASTDPARSSPRSSWHTHYARGALPAVRSPRPRAHRRARHRCSGKRRCGRSWNSLAPSHRRNRRRRGWDASGRRVIDYHRLAQRAAGIRRLRVGRARVRVVEDVAHVGSFVAAERSCATAEISAAALLETRCGSCRAAADVQSCAALRSHESRSSAGHAFRAGRCRIARGTSASVAPASRESRVDRSSLGQDGSGRRQACPAR